MPLVLSDTEKGGLLFPGIVGEVEHHHVGILMMAKDVETVVVGDLEQHVVAIDKLDIMAFRHRQTRVAGDAHATVLLAHVDDLVAIAEQVVHRTLVRAVVDNDDLPLGGLEVQPQDAVDGVAEQLGRQVVVCQDKADQWLLLHSMLFVCKGK